MSFGDIFTVGANQTYDFGMTLLGRKWQHDDRSHDEHRQDSLIQGERDFLRNEVWKREDDLRQQQWDREDALTKDQRAREDALIAQEYGRQDTAYQRSVADATAAGLSPLAALGGSTSSSVPVNISTNTSASDGPGTASSVNTHDPMSHSTLPMMDSSSLISSLASWKNLEETERHNRAAEKQAANELASLNLRSSVELQQQASQFAENLDFLKSKSKDELSQKDTQFWATYYQTASQFTSELEQRQLFHIDEMNWRQKEQAFESFRDDNKVFMESAKQFGLSIDLPVVYVPCTSLEEYNSKLGILKSAMVSGNRNVLNKRMRDPDAFIESESLGNSQSDSESVSASVGAGNSVSDSFKSGKDFASGSLSRNGSLSSSASQSESSSDQWSYKQDRYVSEEVKHQYGSYIECPVLVRDYKEFERDYSSWNKYKR